MMNAGVHDGWLQCSFRMILWYNRQYVLEGCLSRYAIVIAAVHAMIGAGVHDSFAAVQAPEFLSCHPLEFSCDCCRQSIRPGLVSGQQTHTHSNLDSRQLYH